MSKSTFHNFNHPFFGYGWMYEHPSNDDQGLLELGVGVILLSLGGGISGRLLRSHLLLH